MPQKGFIRLWCLVIIFFLIIIIFSNFTDVLAAEGQTTTTGIGKVPKLQSILKELTDQYAIGELIKAESFAASRPLYIRDDKVRVMLELKPGATLDETRLQAYGVEIERKHEGFWRVLAPINSLRRMAQELEEVTYIHSPQKAHPEAISEGVSLSGASAWHTAGYKGQGVKVAVIDEGFEGLTNCIAAGELPSTLTKVNYTGATFETGGTHGVGVAEIVYDMAPQAQMYLIKIDDQSDLTLAKNYCISQGIKVINTSLGYYNSGGYDGTGPLCDIVNDAHSHGILWVKSAGNNGISHYKANYADPNSNNWHNFSSTVENNTLKNWWRIDGKIEKDADISIYLSWGWPTSNQDYDLYLYNNSGQVAASTNPQTGTEPPTEEIVIKAPSTDTYWIKVKKVNATGNQTLTLFSPGYELTYKHPSGSLSQPGDATGCFAVGMLRRENWTTGPLDSYSSRGPTYDGRIKPELVAPSNVTTWTYPAGMYWTSAAAPHAAGAAALVLSAYPSYNVSQVWSYLESNAIDMGTAGKDNDYGSGRLRLPAPPAATPAPTDLMALNSYNGAIPLAWNAPPGIQTESGGFPGDVLNNSLLLLSPKIENNLWKNSLETGSSIELSSLALQGYNVYRSTSSGGPYTKIANKISRQYYRDETVVNGQTYYYVVTAVYDAGESNYSNEAQGQSQTNGYTITSGWASSTPTLDGVINAGEWAQAATTNITYPGYSGTVTLYAMNNSTQLFLAVDDKRDHSLDNLDQFAIFFDENKDREWPLSSPSGEGNFWLAWDGNTSSAFSLFGPRYGWWPDNLGWETRITPPGVSQGISLASGNVQYEGSIHLSTSPLNASPGNVIGLLVFTYDKTPMDFNSFWPQQADRLKVITPDIQTWGQAPFSYGDLKLASSAGNPILSVNPTALNFGTTSTSKTFAISNTGTGTLSWNAYENPDQTWITSVSPPSGTGNATVTVQVNRSGLSAGHYTGTITVSSNGGTQNVTVEMDVQGAVPDSLIVLDGQGAPGSTGNLVNIKLVNTVPVAGVQFTVTDIPDLLTATGGNITSRTPGFTASISPAGTVVLFHASGNLIPAGSGPILQIIYDVATSATIGTNVTLDLHAVTVSKQDASPLPVVEKDGVFAIGGLKGDVNGDGVRNILDIIMIVNIILGKMTPTPEQSWAADCNGDGTINILDIILLINWILHPPLAQEKANSDLIPPAPIESRPASNKAQLSLSDVSLSPGGQAELPVTLSSDGAVAGVQVKITYPAAALKVSAPVLTKRAQEMEMAVTEEKGRLTLLLYSSQGKAIASGNGAIFNLPIEAVGTSEGVVSLDVEEVILADPQGGTMEVTVSPGSVTVAKPLPAHYELGQNYPNPFNPETTIEYRLPHDSQVTLKIFNLLGKEIRVLVAKNQEAGVHKVQWDGRDSQGQKVTSGVYLYQIAIQSPSGQAFTSTRKLVVIR